MLTAGLGLAALLGVVTACGGDDGVKTIELAVAPGDDLGAYQERAFQKILETCNGENPPEEVRIVFPKKDENTEVAAEAKKLQAPLSAPCTAVRTTGRDLLDDSTTTSAKG